MANLRPRAQVIRLTDAAAERIKYVMANAANPVIGVRVGVKNGEHQLTSYWRMPERLYDDAEGLAQWARRAHSVAMRAAARKEKPKRVDRFAKPPSRSKPKPPQGRSRI